MVAPLAAEEGEARPAAGPTGYRPLGIGHPFAGRGAYDFSDRVSVDSFFFLFCSNDDDDDGRRRQFEVPQEIV